MSFIEDMKKKAASNIKTIVLPEAHDIRVQEAARKITDEGFAKVILIGDREAIKTEVDISDIEVINPVESDKYEEYANTFFELRKAKGMTEEQAHETLKDNIYFATMMVYSGDADGMVAGSICSTSDTIRPAFQTIKTAPGIKAVSGGFVMAKGDEFLFFSDCAVNPTLDAEVLSGVAISAADTFKMLVGEEAKVAMLSYSTLGSAPLKADTPNTKVAEATKMAREARPDIAIEGEIQFDAAYDEKVASKKAPNSAVAGHANVFVFPSLEAGNIAYKVAQRLGGWDAYGPILVGLNKPVNDLSRGCSSDDIVGVVAITAVQAAK